VKDGTLKVAGQQTQPGRKGHKSEITPKELVLTGRKVFGRRRLEGVCPIIKKTGIHIGGVVAGKKKKICRGEEKRSAQGTQ